MARGYRFAARPAWVAGHVAVLAGVVTMVLLGHWQLSVSERKHFSLQNFGYALQWWAFSLFSVVFWAKIVRDYGRADADAGSTADLPPAPAEEPVAYRRYVMPQSTDTPAVPDEPADDVHSAYNAYLRSLSDER